jgi:hypothetical protein
MMQKLIYSIFLSSKFYNLYTLNFRITFGQTSYGTTVCHSLSQLSSEIILHISAHNTHKSPSLLTHLPLVKHLHSLFMKLKTILGLIDL